MKNTNITKPLRYFIYARKSSESEERQARSIEDQLRETWELAIREGHTIIGEYTEAQTARKPGRSKFNEMLDRIEAGEADAILSWHPDRLARNTLDGGRIVYLLSTAQLAHLTFANFWFENTSQGLLHLNMAFSQSQYYSDNLSENIRRGIKSKLERGIYPNRAKHGYFNHPKSREIMPDPQTFPLIQQMFHLYASGKYGLAELGVHMYELGLTGWAGNPLSGSQVQRTLKDPFYYGAFMFNGEKYQGTHEPAVSKQVWDSAQTAMRNRGKAKNRRRKHDFAFSGFLRCAECGHAITAEIQKGHHYYHCTKRSKTIECTPSYVREEDIAEQFRGLLDQLAQCPDTWLKKMLAEIEKEESGANTKKRSEMKVLDTEQKKIQTRLSRLADLYVGGDLDRADYNARKSSLIDRKVALMESRKEIARGASGTRFELMKEPLELVLDWKNAPAGADLKKLRDTVAEVGSNWLLDSRSLVWDWVSHYAPLARSGTYLNWRRVRDSNPRYGFITV